MKKALKALIDAQSEQSKVDILKVVADAKALCERLALCTFTVKNAEGKDVTYSHSTGYWREQVVSEAVQKLHDERVKVVTALYGTGKTSQEITELVGYEIGLVNKVIAELEAKAKAEAEAKAKATKAK